LKDLGDNKLMYSIREGLTFDDVLLVPQHSDVNSRESDVDISVKIKNVTYLHPIIPANMQSITGENMAKAVIDSGGLAILHRFMPIEDQINIVNNFRIKNQSALVTCDILDHLAVSVGVKEPYKDYIKRFMDLGIRVFCIDIAHGDSSHGVDMTNWLRNYYSDSLIISGNVATGYGAKRLWSAGADIVKVGVGPGSLCTTRIETGCGVPQLTALMDVAKARIEQEDINDFQHPYYIISDGGIKNAGDVVKALCFSDMVMAGNIFAGCDETPGTILSIMSKTYKEYKGSSTHKTSHIEGVAAIVPTKGKFDSVLNKLLEGLRSGCSYQGAHKLLELQDNPEFVKITNAGLIESHPHNIMG